MLQYKCSLERRKALLALAELKDTPTSSSRKESYMKVVDKERYMTLFQVGMRRFP